MPNYYNNSTFSQISLVPCLIGGEPINPQFQKSLAWLEHLRLAYANDLGFTKD